MLHVNPARSPGGNYDCDLYMCALQGGRRSDLLVSYFRADGWMVLLLTWLWCEVPTSGQAIGIKTGWEMGGVTHSSLSALKRETWKI